MKKTKFFTCIAMLGLVLGLGACEVNVDVGDVDVGVDVNPDESTEPDESSDTSESQPHTHSYEVTEHKDATCTEAGYDVYTCSCGDTYTEPIPALGHDYQPVVTDPTCTEKGYTTYTCSRCGDTYTEDETEATGHTPSGDYLSDEEGHWQVCSVCGEAVGKTAHTPSGEYQSDGNSHWQVCSICGYKLNEETHTAGSVGVIDQLTHGTKCSVCQKVLTQENHTYQAVYDDDLEEWDEVCTVCGYEGGEVDLEDKYVLYGDFADSSWNESPTSSTYTLEYNSSYPVTKVWTRTVKMTAYSGQDYRASFRVIEYGNYDADVVTASHLDANSTGVYESSWNIAVHWGGTYDITIDCSGTTPTIHLDYHNDGYEEPAYTAYAITGEFADASWSVEPAENSTYYISLDETIAERTVTLATGLNYDPSFYVVGYGTWNHVLDYSNLTSDSDSSLKASNDNGIAGEAGQTYDLVLDFVNSTIKVTIHEEEPAPITDEATLKAALEEGGDITLEDDISITATLYLYKSATIDMQGHKIEPESDIFKDDSTTHDWSILSISGDIDVTIKGNGTFASRANDTYAIDVRNGARVTIEDGTYVGNIDCIYIEEGFVSIYGGHFSIIQLYNNSYKWLLNCLDDSFKAGTACFYLYGGEYENFDPSVATGPTVDGVTLYEAVVMDGYTVVSSEIEGGGTLYSVVETPVEEHTFVADLSSLPAAGFGEENTDGKEVPNPKDGTWTRGIFYYWNDQWWVGNNVTVNKAAYDSETEAYVFSWTGANATNPFAFQIFYTLPEEAGLEIGTSYSLKISFTADFTGYIEINGTAQYVTEGENTVTIDALTATQYSDLSIQLGDNLYVDDGKCVQNGTIAITYLAFDYLKADVEEGESESHSYIVDFGSTELYEETDAVGTIGNHLGAFVYNYNLVSGNVNLTNDGLTLTYDKAGSAEPPWSGVTLCYNLPADSGLSEGAGAGYKYTVRLTAEHDCTLRINEEEFTLTGGEEFELYCHQSNYGGAASTAPTILMYFASISDSTLVCPNTINITYLAFDF